MMGEPCAQLDDNLFISDCHIPLEVVQELGITAILTVGNRKLQPYFVSGRKSRSQSQQSIENDIPEDTVPQAKPKFRSLIINLMDEDDENLLRVIPRGISFIKSSIKKQKRKVLVHCMAGMSRSASMCIAYLLNTKKFESLDAALSDVRSKWSRAWPNAGFLFQLHLYEKLGAPSELRRLKYVISDDEKAYRLILLHRWRRLFQEQSKSDSFPLDDLDVESNRSLQCPKRLLATLNYPEQNVKPPEYFLRCRNCRTLICSSHHVFSNPEDKLGDEPPLDEESIGKSGYRDCRISSSTSAFMTASRCPESFNIVPVMLMQNSISKVLSAGDLLCKCKSKIGAYNWKSNEIYMRILAMPSSMRELPAMDLDEVRSHLPVFVVYTRYVDRVFSIH
mmetsp:Transcript_19833/g.34055  ORF Transcript_19833/g.34055 Transcript_19833/m.34055 type:complete len:392 (+) Transcript_19833:403-1578(+)